ncbi:hypothetical protein C8R43DRAFT_1084171 [Mycena crocata]|nr:hypothetical protein C8R43DRAFT_1084171 [Mycena crocata]
MAPRKRCPVCRSKQWHKEPSSGLIACSEGHILQNYRNETTEVDDLGAHSMKKRTLKTNRQKKGRKSRANPELYHGNRGKYLYFQCLQLILRRQISVVVELWNLPPEFEGLAFKINNWIIQVVCRDLWALHLSLLRSPPPPEPYLAAQESDDEATDANPTASTPEREGEGTEEPAPPSSDDDEPEDDPELDELLAENSASESSSSDGESEVETKSMPPVAKSKRPGLNKYEQPVNTLAVIVLACWTLRVPILYRDLTRLIELYELPYLEGTRILPQNMTVHLTETNIQALSPPNAPTASALHNITSSLARRIYATYGVRTPEVNAAPILWRVVTQCLGGSPTLYKLTKRLSAVLSLPLTLHHSLAPRLPRIKARDSESHQYDNVAPELAFAATAIIVLKMVYGLDGKPRLPNDSEDPACDMPRIGEYFELLKTLETTERKNQDTEFDSKTPMTIEDMSDDALDEYLAFCEQALVGPTSEHDVLDRYFPFQRSEWRKKEIVPPARPQMRATEVQGSEGEELRPGEEYTLYHSDGMPDGFATVVNRAAGWVGVEEQELSTIVIAFERRLGRWWSKEARRKENVLDPTLESD